MTRDDFNTVEELRKDFVSYKKEIFCFKFHQVYHNDGWYIYQVNDNWFEVFKENICKKLIVTNGNMTMVNEYLADQNTSAETVSDSSSNININTDSTEDSSESDNTDDTQDSAESGDNSTDGY